MKLEFDDKTEMWIVSLAVLRGLSVEQFILDCITKVQLPDLLEEAKLNKVNEGFDEFYKAYPRKVAPQSARKAWNKIRYREGFKDLVLKALEAQKKSWTNEIFIPHPASWLNGHRWEDEIKPNPKDTLKQPLYKDNIKEVPFDERKRLAELARSFRESL